jgi:hypothetical protein
MIETRRQGLGDERGSLPAPKLPDSPSIDFLRPTRCEPIRTHVLDQGASRAAAASALAES